MPAKLDPTPAGLAACVEAGKRVWIDVRQVAPSVLALPARQRRSAIWARHGLNVYVIEHAHDLPGLSTPVPK